MLVSLSVGGTGGKGKAQVGLAGFEPFLRARHQNLVLGLFLAALGRFHSPGQSRLRLINAERILQILAA